MKKHSGHVATSALVFALVIAAFIPLSAAAAGFIKLGDIKGESMDSGYKGEIEILSWSWGEAESGQSSGMATGRRQHHPITITKTIDRASPILQQANADGRVIPAMTLHLPNNEGKQKSYFKYKLDNVRVSTYQTGGGSGSVPSETFTLNYEKIKQVDKGDKERALKSSDRN